MGRRDDTWRETGMLGAATHETRARRRASLESGDGWVQDFFKRQEKTRQDKTRQKPKGGGVGLLHCSPDVKMGGQEDEEEEHEDGVPRQWETERENWIPVGILSAGSLLKVEDYPCSRSPSDVLVIIGDQLTIPQVLGETWRNLESFCHPRHSFAISERPGNRRTRRETSRANQTIPSQYMGTHKSSAKTADVPMTARHRHLVSA